MMVRTMTLILTLILFSCTLKAPPDKRAVIIQPEKICPYDALFNAVCQVESSGDPFAVGDTTLIGQSYGIVQIRKIRLDHYCDLTGIRYSEQDMFCPEKSKEVFMYFADRIGPYDLERIIRNWNGRWDLTDKYYAKVKSKL